MKRTIKIRERLPYVGKEIEIELPFYWIHDVTLDDAYSSCIWHGRLNPDLSQDEIMQRGGAEFGIERCLPMAPGAAPMDGGYLKPEYASTREDFEKAFQALRDAVAAIEERGHGLD